MKIRMNALACGPTSAMYPGQVYDVPEEQGRAMIDQRVAEPAEPSHGRASDEGRERAAEDATRRGGARGRATKERASDDDRERAAEDATRRGGARGRATKERASDDDRERAAED